MSTPSIVSTPSEKPEPAQPNPASKAPWQTPTLDDFSIAEETAGGTGTGMDATSGPNVS